MKKTIKIPIYDQYIDVVTEDLKDTDNLAYVTEEPLTLHWDPNLWTLKLCAHECVHLTNGIMKRCLMTLDDFDNDEHYAYLYATVFNKIWKLTMKEICNEKT